MPIRKLIITLEKNGIFVFSMQHPIYNLLGDNSKELKISKNYFEKYVTFRESTGIDLRVHASKISDIINGLIRIGFNIETILEPKPLERDVIPHEEGYQEIFEMIPSTLICKVLKVPK